MLPNFQGVQSETEIRERFAVFGRELMYGHQLQYEDRSWQVTSIELYLYLSNSSVWQDVTTHKGDEQLNSGTFYVHKEGRNAPNYSGIDITVGNRASGIYGGVLLREINEKGGSAQTFKRIIRGETSSGPMTWSPLEKALIQNIHGTDIWSGPLRLRRCEEKLDGPLWIGPRKLNSTKMGAERYNEAKLRLATWRTKHRPADMELV